MRRETAAALSAAFNAIEGYLQAQHSLTSEQAQLRDAALSASGAARNALDGEATAVPKPKRSKSPAGAIDAGGSDAGSSDGDGTAPTAFSPPPGGGGASSSSDAPPADGASAPADGGDGDPAVTATLPNGLE